MRMGGGIEVSLSFSFFLYLSIHSLICLVFLGWLRIGIGLVVSYFLYYFTYRTNDLFECYNLVTFFSPGMYGSRRCIEFLNY